MLSSEQDGRSEQGDTVTLTEHLPALQMEGITVDRLRVTNTKSCVVGTKTHVTETWYSHDLKELICLCGGGEYGNEVLTEIRREEPDPKLFYSPDGWRIEKKK